MIHICVMLIIIFSKKKTKKQTKNVKWMQRKKKGGWGWLSFTLLQKVDTHAMTIKLHAFTRGKKERVCDCVCESISECVCVCVCVRERERERE